MLHQPAYAFLEETISLGEMIVPGVGEMIVSADLLISRSHELLEQSRMMLARPRPDVFLGRQHYELIPLPYEIE